jgi:hypothetical protein
VRFTIEGELFNKSREDVERAMNGVQPDRIQQLAVQVNGTWYPVRQVLGKLIGRPPRTLNSGRSMGIMSRYRFPVHDIRTDGPLPEGPQLATAPSSKLDVLRLAVEVAGPGASADQVLERADRFLQWMS